MSGIINSVGSKSGIVGSNVYPAGHLIQTTTNSHTQSSLNPSTSYARVTVTGGSMPFTGQITNVGASNSVLVTMTWSAYMNTDADDGGAWAIYRESTNIYSHTAGHQWYVGGGTATAFYHPMSWTYLDTAPATGTNNYFLGYRKYDGAPAFQVNGDQPFQIIMHEIQG